MSIVLVIIGLVVGGILTGQDMIRAAYIRSQVTQLEKFQTAVATFKDKYSALPGDIPAKQAAQFGFVARGAYGGAGDGNGIIQGTACNCNAPGSGGVEGAGETALFWVDLSTAHLIDQTFSTATANTLAPTDVIGAAIGNYLPQANIGGGNYIYVWSGGIYNGTPQYNGQNYFGLSAVTAILSSSNYGFMTSNPGLTVAQAAAIDTKIDDGFPLSGNVMVYYLNIGSYQEASGGYYNASPTSCFDNETGGPTVPMHYSVQINNGAGVNCALSVKFQTGD